LTKRSRLLRQENIIKSKEADLKAKRAVYNTNNAGLRKKNDEIDVMVKNIANEKHATGKAALQQQLEAFEATRAKLEIERKTAETAKELADSARAQARDDKLEKQKIVSLKQREVVIEIGVVERYHQVFGRRPEEGRSFQESWCCRQDSPTRLRSRHYSEFW
jgi:hypothetical protein